MFSTVKHTSIISNVVVSPLITLSVGLWDCMNFLKDTMRQSFPLNHWQQWCAEASWNFYTETLYRLLFEAHWIKKNHSQDSLSNIKSVSLPAHKCISISKALQSIQSISHVKNAKLLIKGSTRNSGFLYLWLHCQHPSWYHSSDILWNTQNIQLQLVFSIFLCRKR